MSATKNLVKRIAVSMSKGGSGKSTVTRALAVGLARMGKIVHVVDVDIGQWSVASWFARRQPAQFVAPKKGRLTVVHLEQPMDEQIEPDVDFVLYDLPGRRTDQIVRSVLVEVDQVVIPVRASYDESDALPAFLEELGRANMVRSHALPGCVIINAARADWPGTTRQFREDIAAGLPSHVKLLETTIHEYHDWFVTRGNGLTPIEHRPDGPAAREQKALTKEFIQEVTHGAA